jgi:hypothetical protein
MAKMREIFIVHCRSIFSSIVFVEQQMLQNSMSLLSVQISHLNLVANLPLHHRDLLSLDNCSIYGGTNTNC